MRRLAIGALAAGALMLAGCSSPAPEAARQSTTTTTAPTTSSTPVATSVPTNPAITSTTVPPPIPVPTTTTTLPRTIGFLAQAASFVSAASGFVMGDVRCGASVCLALRHTANGGATWAHVTPPGPANARNTTEVTDLQFADPSDGWAYGATLWATHNGAIGWTKVHIGGSVDALATADGEAYALVDPCQTLTCAPSDRLERSPVGEDAWTKVATKTAVFAHNDPTLAVRGTTVFVLTTALGAATATLASSVGGAPFRPLPIPCQAPPPGYVGPMTAQSMTAGSASTLAVVCVGNRATGTSLKQVFVSGDGGHTFVRQPDPPSVGDGATIALPAPSNVLVVTDGAVDGVFRLTAPATTWVSSLSLADGGVGLTSLGFVDARHGFLIDGAAQRTLTELSLQSPAAPFGRLYLSADGGASWHMVQVPG